MDNCLTTNNKKRSYEAVEAGGAGAVDEDNPTEQEVAAMSRSERKRHREKKRRSDVNKGFDELMALLLEIDPEVRADAEERASKGQCKRSLGAHEDNVLSRVDLIATSIKVLKRVHLENEKHKKVIEELLKKNGGQVSSAAAAGLGSQGGYGFDAASSLMDRRTSLLQQSAAMGSGSAQAWEAAQLRAKANILSGLPSGANALRDYSTADLLALRAAAANRAANVNSLPPPPAQSDAAAMLAARRNLLQTMMQQNSQSDLMRESIFGAAAARQTAADNGPASSSSLLTEGLYSALGGGAMQSKKEEELRRLRAAGHQL